MDYDLTFGKSRNNKKPKLNKKILDSMSLKSLKSLAKKYKISYYKKGTKVNVKKSTLLKRLKKSRSINKILENASKMKKNKKTKSKFGMKNQLPANYPNFHTPLELSLAQTYNEQLRHYKNIPITLKSTNFQGPANYSNGIDMDNMNKPYNFEYNRGSMGRSSLPSYKNINDPQWQTSYPNKFGRYFH